MDPRDGIGGTTDDAPPRVAPPELAPDARPPDARQLQVALAAAGRRRRTPIALAAVVVAVAVAGAAVLVARSGDRGRGTGEIGPPRTGDAELFPLVGEPEHWPRDAATSVAVAPTAPGSLTPPRAASCACRRSHPVRRPRAGPCRATGARPRRTATA